MKTCVAASTRREGFRRQTPSIVALIDCVKTNKRLQFFSFIDCDQKKPVPTCPPLTVTPQKAAALTPNPEERHHLWAFVFNTSCRCEVATASRFHNGGVWMLTLPWPLRLIHPADTEAPVVFLITGGHVWFILTGVSQRS